MINDPPFHSCQKPPTPTPAIPPPHETSKSHPLFVCTCICVGCIHTILQPACQSPRQTLRPFRLFPSVPVASTTSAFKRDAHTHTLNTTHSQCDLHLRAAGVGKELDAIEWMDTCTSKRGEGVRREWTPGSILLCQSIFAQGSLDESCQNSPHYNFEEALLQFVRGGLCYTVRKQVLRLNVAGRRANRRVK